MSEPRSGRPAGIGLTIASGLRSRQESRATMQPIAFSMSYLCNGPQRLPGDNHAKYGRPEPRRGVLFMSVQFQSRSTRASQNAESCGTRTAVATPRAPREATVPVVFDRQHALARLGGARSSRVKSSGLNLFAPTLCRSLEHVHKSILSPKYHLFIVERIIHLF